MMKLGERGFTFIEAVISLLILSILITGSVTIAGKGVGGLNLKQDRQTAKRIGESLQDELGALSHSSARLAAGYTETRYYDLVGRAVADTDPSAVFKVTMTTSTESKAAGAVGGPITLAKVSADIIWDTNHGNPTNGITNPEQYSITVWR